MIDLQKFPGKPLVAAVLIWIEFLSSRILYFLPDYFPSFFSVETYIAIAPFLTIAQLASFFYIWLTCWKIIQTYYPKASLDVFFILVLLGVLLSNLYFFAYQTVVDISPSLAQSGMTGMNLFRFSVFMLFGVGVLNSKMDLFGRKKPFGILLILNALAGSLFWVLPLWSSDAFYSGITGIETVVFVIYSIVFTQIFLRAHKAESGSLAPPELFIEEIGEADDDL